MTIPAIHFEGIKYAYRQSKDGIVVSFVVHPQDVPAELSTSSIGARYMVALVEIDDDEQPKAGKPKKERKAEPKPEPAHVTKGKQNWRDMLPSAQSAIRCNEPTFWAYLHEYHTEVVPEKLTDADSCAAAVRVMCGVGSRSELNTKQASRVIWQQLDSGFQAWKALEHA